MKQAAKKKKPAKKKPAKSTPRREWPRLKKLEDTVERICMGIADIRASATAAKDHADRAARQATEAAARASFTRPVAGPAAVNDHYRALEALRNTLVTGDLRESRGTLLALTDAAHRTFAVLRGML